MEPRAETPARWLSLHDRVALVTGSAGGIGSAVARLFGEAGARVVGVDLRPSGAGDGTTELACDLADATAVRTLLEGWKERFGRLDVLIHCAGITRDAVLWKMDDEDWDRVLRVNLDSAFYLLRSAVPLMREQGSGTVVLVSSINGERGKFGQANYAASKAGLIALARTAAREVGRFGVRVNVIAPGLIETAMTAKLPPEIVQRALDESALGRIGRPGDVARAALFLATELSGHITGQVLRVDGGQLTA